MATSKIDLSAGMIPKKPTHPYGTVSGYDEQSGLPIVRRREAAADTQAKPMQADADTVKPDTKPEKPETKPASAEAQPSKPDPKPAKDETATKPDAAVKPAAPAKLEKGAPVTVNGKAGKLIYMHDKMRIGRVHMEDGKTITANLKDIKASEQHVAVQAHYRKIPEK